MREKEKEKKKKSLQELEKRVSRQEMTQAKLYVLRPEHRWGYRLKVSNSQWFTK